MVVMVVVVGLVVVVERLLKVSLKFWEFQVMNTVSTTTCRLIKQPTTNCCFINSSIHLNLSSRIYLTVSTITYNSYTDKFITKWKY